MTDGAVLTLWRYPLKSMQGEELNASHLNDRGLLGDRALALVDVETGKVVRGLDKLSEDTDVVVYHAATAQKDGTFLNAEDQDKNAAKMQEGMSLLAQAKKLREAA